MKSSKAPDKSGALLLHTCGTLSGYEVMMSETVPTRADLIAEFAADEDSTFASGRTNNITDIALSILSVFGSLAATVLVSTKSPTALTASVAAIPAACTSLQRIVNFRARSHWYFQHAASLKALAVALKYATDPDLELFAKRRAELEVEGEQGWSKLGSGPARRKGP